MKPNIKKRKLGKTDLYVTELSYGAMNLRMLNSFDEAHKILNYVLDQGVNLIDTARAYMGEIAPGVVLESERVVGDVIRNRTDLKEPITIITKGHAYTIEGLESELELSLRTLGVTGKKNLKIGATDIKLIYLIHGITRERWDSVMSSGVLDRLKTLKEEGVINYIGFSSHYPEAVEIKEAIDTGVFDVVELPYNVFNRSLGEDGDLNLLEYIYNKNIGIINMKAFDGNGMVPVYKILREFISIDYSAMLNFCLSNPYITAVDAGARFVEEFEADIKTALANRYSSEELVSIKAEADKVSKHVKHVCRECMHCIEKFECPNKLDFPGLMSVYSRFTISENLGKDTSEFVDKYATFELNGSDCLECGACLPWCEYKLNIPEMLKKAHEKLSR
jgi:predicted aldo/keto reductase-like oxidoreductase